jgi:two-component system, chemotaxis family, protein-glutamate methylesterase/glutaminase
MSNRDILAIGTSAGGVNALLFLVRKFRRDLPASVLVTIHLPSHSASSLDDLLDRSGPLRAKFASDGERLEKGVIYVAPPDLHLIVEDRRLCLGEGPRENNVRPAVDPMLRSAAVCCGSRTVGAVLTGTMGDGASGLWAVREAGGIAVVQDPSDALFSEMPLAAITRAAPHYVTRLEDMPALFDCLARGQADVPRPTPPSLEYEVRIAKGGSEGMHRMDKIGRRSVLACPDCGGVMWEIEEGGLSRYRCHVGHTYTGEVMSLALDDGLRRALESARRALAERVALARRLHRQAVDSGHSLLARSWVDQAEEFERELEIVDNSIRRVDRLAADRDRSSGVFVKEAAK